MIRDISLLLFGANAFAAVNDVIHSQWVLFAVNVSACLILYATLPARTRRHV